MPERGSRTDAVAVAGGGEDSGSTSVLGRSANRMSATNASAAASANDSQPASTMHTQSMGLSHAVAIAVARTVDTGSENHPSGWAVDLTCGQNAAGSAQPESPGGANPGVRDGSVCDEMR
ncbi:hypothetical protein [Geodermatophilus sabuli]|uniref:hypothetical protein n=1 Tax=Geodermatophilus sabuli TaxID=1564158 RepID=UPI00117BAB74|nr:hypothetical protein [Geodermatophilus sabuli]